MANSRQNIRKLVKDGFVIRKPQKIHSRARTLRNLAAKQKGRHTATVSAEVRARRACPPRCSGSAATACSVAC